MTVRAFQPRQYDPPQFVAEDVEELAELLGGFIGAGQCDGCGCATYRVVEQGGVYYGRCEVDPTDDVQHPAPCGTRYPIRLWDEDDVCF